MASYVSGRADVDLETVRRRLDALAELRLDREFDPTEEAEYAALCATELRLLDH